MCRHNEEGGLVKHLRGILSLISFMFTFFSRLSLVRPRFTPSSNAHWDCKGSLADIKPKISLLGEMDACDLNVQCVGTIMYGKRKSIGLDSLSRQCTKGKGDTNRVIITDVRFPHVVPSYIYQQSHSENEKYPNCARRCQISRWGLHVLCLFVLFYFFLFELLSVTSFGGWTAYISIQQGDSYGG